MGALKKRCRACLQVLPLEAFPIDRHASGGYRADCKLCRKVRRAELEDGAPRCGPGQRFAVYAEEHDAV